MLISIHPLETEIYGKNYCINIRTSILIASYFMFFDVVHFNKMVTTFLLNGIAQL